MGFINNFRLNRQIKNAAQPSHNTSGINFWNNMASNTSVYSNGELSTAMSGAGKYDNFYGDYKSIIAEAPTHEIKLVDYDNNVVDDGDFSDHLRNLNSSYPQFKVLQQVYSSMITKGYVDLFIWRKDGKNEVNTFDHDKRYNQDDFRGVTLTDGYELGRLPKNQLDNIVRITYGVSQHDVFMGYSPTQAAQSWRKMQDSMGLHMTKFASNGGIPSGQWIITARSYDDFEIIREKLDAKMSGAKNNGKQLYSYRPSEASEPQLHWQEFSSRDVQDYTNQLEFAEKKLSQAFGVPGTVKGTNDGEAYASARVSEHIFIKYTIRPLVLDFLEQFKFALSQRFDINGELHVDIQLPEIADESLVKIRATTAQVALFDKKITEGFTAESIVAAYSLPQSFLLLEKDPNAAEIAPLPTEDLPTQAIIAAKSGSHKHEHTARDEFERRYQSAFTQEERQDIESKFRKVVDGYVDNILANGNTDAAKQDFEGQMEAVFTEKYSSIYDKTLDSVGDELAGLLGTVDISTLDLTDDELSAAKAEYSKRVADFSTSFAEQIEALEGKTLEARKTSAAPKTERVVVSESEHTRIVSELQCWAKSEQEFPVRVYKTWNTLPGACEECLSLADTKIDVTALFVNSTRVDEIYEVQGGGLHPSCRCYVQYEMERS